MHRPTDRITHTTAFVTPIVEHWLEREIAQSHALSHCYFNFYAAISNRYTVIFIHRFPFTYTCIGRKEMFYLTTHSTNFIMLYGVEHMVKNHSDSERRNPMPPHRVHFSICNKEYFIYAPSHRQDSTHHGLCYTSRPCGIGTSTEPFSDQNTTIRLDPSVLLSSQRRGSHSVREHHQYEEDTIL